jgi:hypothetical protein
LSSEAINEYVKTKVSADQQPIVAALRELMKECAPEAVEVISHGSLAWKGNKGLAIVSLSKTHITFAFDRGAEFADKHGLLEGEGKKTRHVKIKKPDTINKDALCDYIQQAAALDKA